MEPTDRSTMSLTFRIQGTSKFALHDFVQRDNAMGQKPRIAALLAETHQ
jgi:hypothetical protein